ncbi:ROK family protein [Pseudactinotalea terrae]|uniref:ROK family protein n=1 Tax=Pseudactinotalea terrae TaxID=1743262 RepID=UPI0019D54D09|nr:ROK family protein [Pseudactinotalea terrae]
MSPDVVGVDLGPGAPVAVLDVGGTEIKTSVLDGEGHLSPAVHSPTPRGADVVERVLDAVSDHVEQVRDAQPAPAAVGLVVPGIVDADRGVAVFSENLVWHDVPFRDLVAERTGLPVGFGHDVATAGRAELELGAARGVADAAVLVVGTGIAAALFVEGRPLLGHGWAGELGHSVVDPGGPACVCGAHGCLEAIASAAAITRRYTAATGIEVPGAREVLALAEAGDEAARNIWDNAIAALAAGIRQLAAILSPEVVVIGGGLSRAGDALFGPLADAVGRTTPPHRVPELRPAAIGAYAGLVGAALLGREAAR